MYPRTLWTVFHFTENSAICRLCCECVMIEVFHTLHSSAASLSAMIDEMMIHIYIKRIFRSSLHHLPNTSHQWYASTFFQWTVDTVSLSCIYRAYYPHWMPTVSETLKKKKKKPCCQNISTLTQTIVHVKWIMMVVNGVKPAFGIVTTSCFGCQ